MLQTQDGFEFFVFFMQTPIVLLIGLLGNSLGLFVIWRKKFLKLGPREMYLSLFIIDSLILISTLNFYLSKAFEINFTIQSSLACKLFMYLEYSMAPVSSMLLVYILAERFLSIKYPVESNLLRNKNIQLIFLVVTIIFNMIYYLIVPFSYDVITYEYDISFNTTTSHFNPNKTIDIGCYFVNASKKRIISNLVIIHKIFLPVGLMILFSVLLIHSIFKSRSRVLILYSKREINLFKSDVQLSIMWILINLIFIGLNVPFAGVLLFYEDYSDLLFYFTLNLFYLSYAFNFYFFLLFNSMFRQEFISSFKSEPHPVHSTYTSSNDSFNLRLIKYSFYQN